MMEATNTSTPPSASRATRFMMEGVGARVIRGPDWKWGKQVRLKKFKLNKNFSITSCELVYSLEIFQWVGLKVLVQVNNHGRFL